MRMTGPVAFTLLATTACGHSAPSGSELQLGTGPFAAAIPVRLTYSELSDEMASLSPDGTLLVYSYERPTADGDRCLGIIPSGGGTRRVEQCAWSLGESDSADGLGAPALRDDGMLAFTVHSGRIGNLTSSSMGLYLDQVDDGQPATRVLALGARPAGASSSWSELVDPTWLANGDLMVLGARRMLVNTNGCGEPPDPTARDCDRTSLRDTLGIGIEFARLRIEPTGANVIATIPAPDAIAWSLDATTQQIHYIVQRPRADLADIFHESLADTLYMMPVGGGAPVLRYGTAGGDAGPLERMHGVASGHGRVFISRSWRGPNVGSVITAGDPLFSDISEVLADGSLRTIADRMGRRWGRLRLTPDGRALIAEAIIVTSPPGAPRRTQTDLYRIELGP